MIDLFFAAFWKSGAALGAALITTRILGKQSAALRRLVLSAALVSMFLAAAALPALPHWFVYQRKPVPTSFAAQPTFSVDPVEPAAISAAPSRAAAPRLNLMPWLLPLAWVGAAAALLTRFALSLRRLHWLRISAAPVTALDLLAHVAAFGRDIALLQSDTVAAPVTWGIVRPVILLPAAMERLPQESQAAVLRHEAAHIEARDFLMRVLSEIACALLWFQPLLWILCRQLREEQELACDDSVLASGSKPSEYAKLLLDWNAAPTAWVAVGMAHRSCLKRRIVALLDPGLRRGGVARAAAAATWILALTIAIPLAAIGLSEPAAQSDAPRPQTPASEPQLAFDVASIKPCQPGDGPGRGGKGAPPAGPIPNMPEGIGGYFSVSPGRLDVTCGSIMTMVRVAYIDHDHSLLNNPGGPMSEPDLINGAPKWAMSARYTIHAESEDPAAKQPTRIGNGPGSRPGPAAAILYGPMFRRLLEDRFHLQLHRETQEAPMYALTVAKGGVKLKPMQDGECIPQGRPEWPADGKPPCHWVGWDTNGPDRRLLLGGIDFKRFALTLSELVLDRNVIDRTGLDFTFLSRLEYAPDDNTHCMGPPQMCAVDLSSALPPGPNIFNALQQQFGLKLETIKGPREHLVIDHVEPPSEN